MNKSRVRTQRLIVDKGLNSEDIFDLKITEEVPDSVLKNLARESLTVESCIMTLFNIKARLTVSEIIIALWRRYELEMPRTRVQGVLGNMIVKNFIKREGRGVYVKEEKI